MKRLQCSQCGEYLGEIEKGRIKKNIVIFCIDCHERINLPDITKKYSDINKLFNGDDPLSQLLRGIK